MKKPLFLFLTLALISSCQKTVSKHLESDKQVLFSATREQYQSVETYFNHSLTNERKDDLYLVTYQIYEPKQDFKEVRCIVTPDKKSAFFFGYEESYQIVKDVAKQDSKNHIYNGLKISFSSTIEIKHLDLYFVSQEINLLSEINS